MIPHARVLEVRRLLQEGKHSQRQIAKLTGTSRSTVNLIAQGRRPDYEPRVEVEAARDEGPPERCASCGGMVCKPCRLCQVRASRARSRATPATCAPRPPTCRAAPREVRDFGGF